MNTGTFAIKAEGLSKHYQIGTAEEAPTMIREAVSRTISAPFKRLNAVLRNQPLPEAAQGFWALRDVSFEVKVGEAVGLIGHNGAGKSTLLKVLSRITTPTEGQVRIHGRIGALLEVGTGFHPELTGRENVYLNGTILGMKRAEITRKFDEIVAFAEIGKFIDTPVKRYSSGMYARLAFAVCAHLEPEILIVDEVLAVGDASFQKKSLGKMNDVAREGRTVIFVSHNMAAIENLCSRGIVLNRGQVAFMGTQHEAINYYLEGLNGQSSLSLRDRADRTGSGALHIVGFELRNAQGHPLELIASGQDVDMVIHYETTPDFNVHQSVTIGLAVKTLFDVPVFLQTNRLTGDTFGTLPETGAFVLRLPHLPVTPATYWITLSVMGENGYLDRIQNALQVTVIEGDFFGTGELPTSAHGPQLIEGHWRLAEHAVLEGHAG